MYGIIHVEKQYLLHGKLTYWARTQGGTDEQGEKSGDAVLANY